MYVRWMQETRRCAASTVSRRMSVVGGFYRTCVIDEILEHSPAEYVRRPNVPPESPTLGLSHLQLEALLTASRTSDNESDFALVCLLGLLGLRIFEACAADITDLGEEHGHRVLRVVGKGHKVVLVPLPPAVARSVDRAIANRVDGPLLLNTLGRRMDRHAATPPHRDFAGSPTTPASDCRACTRTCSATPTSPRCSTLTGNHHGVDLRDVQIAARHADPRTTMRYDRARTTLDRHPNYILAADMASGT
jgi:integrase/recombinase XerD